MSTAATLHPLQKVIARQKAGEALGVWSACTSQRTVLEACLHQAATDATDACVESTCNQVDQFGGYSGMTPDQFVGYVRGICEEVNFPFDRVILGGDHLGPNPWRKESAQTAMPKALELVRAYVRAGYTKLHLDASMRCADDPAGPHGELPDELVAERAAHLCAAAEEEWRATRSGASKLVYIIGTEVPIPGGAQESELHIRPTTPESASRTAAVSHQMFLQQNFEEAWTRVVAMVVQPGVEFSDNAVAGYQREAAAPLREWIAREPRFVFEAHSTDYQSGKALRELVEDQFAILKVGPGLTYAFREGLFALEEIEREWLGRNPAVELSQLSACLEAQMLTEPGHWKEHYHGDAATVGLARRFSFSDRCRYYWATPPLQHALERLIGNLEARPAPLSLLSQYLPLQYAAVREGLLPNRPQELLRSKVREVTALYSQACGHS